MWRCRLHDTGFQNAALDRQWFYVTYITRAQEKMGVLLEGIVKDRHIRDMMSTVPAENWYFVRPVLFYWEHLKFERSG